jgi:hypothetical protein
MNYLKESNRNKLAICTAIISLLLLAGACKKANKKAGEMIPGNTWEIASMKFNGEEVLDRFFADSCLCKKMHFSKSPSTEYPYEYRVYFKDCSSQITGLFSSAGAYGIYEHTAVKPRKFAFLGFNNFTHSVNDCKCGRFGLATYFTITDIDTKKQTWSIKADLADGLWELQLVKSN